MKLKGLGMFCNSKRELARSRKRRLIPGPEREAKAVKEKGKTAVPMFPSRYSTRLVGLRVGFEVASGKVAR